MLASDFMSMEAWAEACAGPHPRETDREIAKRLGWRVSEDPHCPQVGKIDDYVIRRDGRLDIPCNEELPVFTPDMVRNLSDSNGEQNHES